MDAASENAQAAQTASGGLSALGNFILNAKRNKSDLATQEMQRKQMQESLETSQLARQLQAPQVPVAQAQGRKAINHLTAQAADLSGIFAHPEWNDAVQATGTPDPGLQPAGPDKMADLLSKATAQGVDQLTPDEIASAVAQPSRDPGQGDSIIRPVMQNDEWVTPNASMLYGQLPALAQTHVDRQIRKSIPHPLDWSPADSASAWDEQVMARRQMITPQSMLANAAKVTYNTKEGTTIESYPGVARAVEGLGQPWSLQTKLPGLEAAYYPGSGSGGGFTTPQEKRAYIDTQRDAFTKSPEVEKQSVVLQHSNEFNNAYQQISQNKLAGKSASPYDRTMLTAYARIMDPQARALGANVSEAQLTEAFARSVPGHLRGVLAHYLQEKTLLPEERATLAQSISAAMQSYTDAKNQVAFRHAEALFSRGVEPDDIPTELRQAYDAVSSRQGANSPALPSVGVKPSVTKPGSGSRSAGTEVPGSAGNEAQTSGTPKSYPSLSAAQQANLPQGTVVLVPDPITGKLRKWTP